MISSKNVNIKSGNIEFNFENGNIDSKTGSNGAPRGVKRGHSIPYHHQQGAPPPLTPRGPRLTPFLLSMLPFSKLNSMLPSLWFRFNQPPHFSMLPYSMLVTFPKIMREDFFCSRSRGEAKSCQNQLRRWQKPDETRISFD